MKSEDLYLGIINNLCDGVYFVDTERRITFWNKAAEEITGYKAEEIVGKKCEDNLLSHIDAEGRPLCIVGCPLYATIIDNKQRKETVFLRHKDGHRIPILVNIFPMQEDGKTVGAIEIFTVANSSIMYDDNLVEQLSNVAMKDGLTGLPNRRYLESYLEYRLSEFQRFQRTFAVAFVDIDDFRSFNNNYGHDMGDLVMKNITSSVKNSLRKEDTFGRWGGEEFVGIFTTRRSYDAPIMGEKVRMLVANTQVPCEEPLTVTVSVGITNAREGDTMDTIIKRADGLMYQSKSKGKNLVSAD